MTVCKHVRYSGRVQGVGFRYTTQRLAESFPVAGFVRNLPDGDVEVVAEGEAAQVEAFLAALGRQMAGYIQQCTQQEQTPGGYKGFRIRY
ncbi:MAG: acylphosphatase [Gemmataceae bacterium]|nr:acylphosphatase [Gemmataceae bacterium]